MASHNDYANKLRRHALRDLNLTVEELTALPESDSIIYEAAKWAETQTEDWSMADWIARTLLQLRISRASAEARVFNA
jgi:hypothetical protein